MNLELRGRLITNTNVHRPRMTLLQDGPVGVVAFKLECLARVWTVFERRLLPGTIERISFRPSSHANLCGLRMV